MHLMCTPFSPKFDTRYPDMPAGGYGAPDLSIQDPGTSIVPYS